jgi:hypothetical protein
MGKFREKFKGAASARPNPLEGQAEALQGKPPQDLFCLNFKYFDPGQGETFSQWEEAKLLAKTAERWREHSRKKLEHCLDTRFKRYGAFPAKSEFTHPKGVPPDAVWASMHVQGQECVIGHIHYNVFYVVFLDRHHKFWPTELKHT